jgi:hypothetical protein
MFVYVSNRPEKGERWGWCPVWTKRGVAQRKVIKRFF